MTNNMFWGLRLEAGKRYSTTVNKSFHVSMAALDCSSVKSDNETLTVMLEDVESNVSFVLCNLHKLRSMQCPLDLNFFADDRVTFYCKGNGTVYLTGYIVPEDDFGGLGDDDDIEEEEEDEITKEIEARDKVINGMKLKRKSDGKQSTQVGKKTRLYEESTAEENEDDDSDEGEDDDTFGIDSSFPMGTDSDDSDEDEAEETDEDESEEEVKAPAPAPAPAKKEKKKSISDQNLNKSVNKQNRKSLNGATPSPKVKPEKKDKLKTPTTQNVPGNSTDSPMLNKTIEAGVHIKDVKIGNGPICKSGRNAVVYYTGRFKNNNKLFDSTTSGPGFKFKVGKGEVIKGWDVGVVGMKVGGKRLITCPPHAAYGQKGSPPTIPANSTLVFEVELKSMN